MKTLFNKVLGENEKCVFYFYLKPNELFGQPNTLSFAVVDIIIHILSSLSKLIYLFLAALGLCRCVRAFSGCGERGLVFVSDRGLLIAVASLVVEHGL